MVKKIQFLICVIVAACCLSAASLMANPAESAESSEKRELILENLAVVPHSLSFGEVTIGESLTLAYTIEGSLLVDDIIITAPDDFQLSTSQSGDFSDELILEPADGSINQTVFVRFSPTAAIEYDDQVTNESGSVTVSVSLSGTGVDGDEPSLAVDPPILNFGEVEIGKYRTYVYTLTGQNLDEDVVVASTSGFWVSLDQHNDFSSELTVEINGGDVDQLIYVRFIPEEETEYSGSITNVSGETSIAVAVSGTGIPLEADLVVNPENLMFDDTVIGRFSILEYTLTGTDVSGDITIQAPANFQLSFWGNEWSSELVLPFDSMEIEQQVYVRFWPQNEGEKSGNVTHSIGPVSLDLEVQGTGITPPDWVEGRVIGWGRNTDGQSGNSGGFDDFVTIAADGGHTIGLRSNGTINVWGSNTFGQLNKPLNLANIIDVAAGGFHSLALKTDGTVVAWGNQVQVPDGVRDVIQLQGGLSHTIYLTANGTVSGWGDNTFGQLSFPDGLQDVVQIATGWHHNLALHADGTISAWGANEFGQSNIPDGMDDVVYVAAGSNHSLALHQDGTVTAWGNNQFGQTDVPSGLAFVTQIAAGGSHSLVLLSDGTVLGWGANYAGQLDVPEELDEVVAIASGLDHSLALTTSTAVSVDDPEPEIPAGLELAQNYPNPFNPTTQIEFGLPDRADVRLDVFNITGQRVATLVNDNLPAGYHTASFDAGLLSSGIYIYRITAGNQMLTRKMILVK